jgi:hypothetical protein
MKTWHVLVLCGGFALGAHSGATRLEAQEAAPSAAPQKPTFHGDIALWTVAIKPDKTGAFEHIMLRVREALAKSTDPARQRQAAGVDLGPAAGVPVASR